MGREVKRVPLDFDQPLNEVWPGFLMPDSLREKTCETCDGSGYSGHAKRLHDLWYGYAPFSPAITGSEPFTVETPEARAFAERNVSQSPVYYGRGEEAIVREAQRLAEFWNASWSHHLDQGDADALVEAGRLHDLTHTWKKGDGWQPITPAPQVTARQVNLWALSGFGHDAINCWVVIRARCKRDGQPETCAACEGHGSAEVYPGQRAEAEAWTHTEPPTGDGWQLWETVSEGSPISPVFATDMELAEWMTANRCTVSGPMPSVEAALKFVRAGWAPSLIATPETGVIGGAEWIGGEPS